jgi:hypothetical protein
VCYASLWAFGIGFYGISFYTRVYQRFGSFPRQIQAAPLSQGSSSSAQGGTISIVLTRIDMATILVLTFRYSPVNVYPEHSILRTKLDELRSSCCRQCSNPVEVVEQRKPVEALILATWINTKTVVLLGRVSTNHPPL